MGWAWRSSESYGDKDEKAKEPDTESSGAKEPAADGGEAEEKGSWWDQFHKNDSYTPTYTTRSESDYEYDDWRGYRGPVYDGSSYSYDASIDDSDSRWYRRNSFKYSKYKDYSPSSLFRSAFYSSKSSFFTATSAENEAKNKAIRALRTLSRNANTICDKNAKISYAVQYSSGANVNTFEETLIDGKSVKTIYVSPDSVVKAETTEDEDEAVDALTGFVLLRVQIAQEFDANTITKINDTTLRSLPRHLVRILREKDVPSGAAVAAEHVNNCLAGMLAKGMLTRLARRAVVKDWGGFAPYFVRHTKKFSSIREKLEKAELSIESVVGKLTYNTIDDENVLEIDADVEKIVSKHLGEEIPAENILETCCALIAELREYLKTKLTTPEKDEAGPIEQSLRDMLEKFMADHAEAMAAQQKEAEAAESMLGELAQAMNEQFSQNMSERSRTPSSLPNEEEFANEATELYSAEQMVAALKAQINELKQHLEELKRAEKETPHLTPAYVSRAQYEQMQVDAKHRHFAALKKKMEDRGAKEKFNPADYNGAPADKLAETLAREIADLQKLVEDYQQVIKADTLELRDKIVESAEEFNAAAAVNKKIAAENIEKIKAHAESLRKKFDEVSAATSFRAENLEEIVKAAERMQDYSESQYKQVDKSLGDTFESISACRSIKTLRTTFDRFRNAVRADYTVDMRADWQYRLNDMNLATFVQAGIREHNRIESQVGSSIELLKDKIAETKWHIAAIKRFLDQLQNNNDGFEANALSETQAEAFKQLEKLFEGLKKVKEEGMPDSTDGLESPELVERINALARSIGLADGNELLQMFKESESTIKSTLAEAGRQIGKKVRDLMPLFDEINSADNQLFGELVTVETTVLEDATKQVNDEARNDPEEEFVAYLSHSEAKPVVNLKKPRVTNRARKDAHDSRVRQRNIIARIREALQFHNAKRTGDIYGVRSGDLDEGGLHKLGYDCEHIWSQKTIAQIPDVAVGILVDQSGSMSSCHKIYEAREMCIALAEAVKKIPGIHLHIYGHTANLSGESDLVLFEHYSSTSDSGSATADLSTLGTIDAMSNNYDGYAIKETAKLLAKDPAKRKYLFVIADGLPHGDGYAGKDAEKHVTSVCQFVRERLKIATYAFAVGVDGSYRNKFISQYGKDNVMFLTTVGACLPQITRFLRNTIQKEKTLVEVST